MTKVIRKANPTANEVHENAILTNISIAYMQDTSDFIADKVFPIVPVSKQSDKYFTYNQNDWFRDEAEKRAPSTESAGGGYRHSTDNYSCDIWAFHKDIDATVMGNYDNPLDPERDSAEFVTQKLLIRREREFVTNYMAASVWDNDFSGGASGTSPDFVYFDDKANSDPIGLITEKKRTIKTNTGFTPNILAIGGEVWDDLKQHPDIIERIKYTQNAINISPQLVAQALEVDQLVIAEGIYATNEEGATAAYSQIVGDDMLLVYAPSSPGLLKPSAGYIFAWEGYGDGNAYGTNIYSWFMRNIKSTRVEGELAFDTKVVASALGAFFDDVMS